MKDAAERKCSRILWEGLESPLRIRGPASVNELPCKIPPSCLTETMTIT